MPLPGLAVIGEARVPQVRTLKLYLLTFTPTAIPTQHQPTVIAAKEHHGRGGKTRGITKTLPSPMVISDQAQSRWAQTMKLLEVLISQLAFKMVKAALEALVQYSSR